MKINKEVLKEDLEIAKQIACEVFGNAEPSVVASVMNGITAQRLDAELASTVENMTSEICRAAAVASGG